MVRMESETTVQVDKLVQSRGLNDILMWLLRNV